MRNGSSQRSISRNPRRGHCRVERAAVQQNWKSRAARVAPTLLSPATKERHLGAGNQTATVTVERNMRTALTALPLVVTALLVSSCSSDGADEIGLTADFAYEVDYETTGPTSCPARLVSFTDNSQGDPDEWHWDFPDGTTSDLPSPTLQPSPGAETVAAGDVTLTVSRGETSDSITRRVEVVAC